MGSENFTERRGKVTFESLLFKIRDAWKIYLKCTWRMNVSKTRVWKGIKTAPPPPLPLLPSIKLHKETGQKQVICKLFIVLPASKLALNLNHGTCVDYLLTFALRQSLRWTPVRLWELSDCHETSQLNGRSDWCSWEGGLYWALASVTRGKYVLRRPFISKKIKQRIKSNA